MLLVYPRVLQENLQSAGIDCGIHKVESASPVKIIRGGTHEAVNKWFDVFEATVREYNIQPRDVYNMDETGFSIGMIQASRVVVSSNVSTQYQAHPGRQEWVSIVECICVDGTR